MKTILITILLQIILITPVFTQQNNDYVVLLNNDTVSISQPKLKTNKIICTVNGIKTKYISKNILAYKVGIEVGESGKVRPALIGFKRWIFLERKITGKISLYTIVMYDMDIHSSGTSTANTVNFYRKVGEPNRQFHKGIYWSRLLDLLNDCPVVIEKINSDNTFYKINEIIEFYNANCGDEI